VVLPTERVLKAVSSETAIIAKSNAPIAASSKSPTLLCPALSVVFPAPPISSAVPSYNAQKNYLLTFFCRPSFQHIVTSALKQKFDLPAMG